MSENTNYLGIYLTKLHKNIKDKNDPFTESIKVELNKWRAKSYSLVNRLRVLRYQFFSISKFIHNFKIILFSGTKQAYLENVWNGKKMVSNDQEKVGVYLTKYQYFLWRYNNVEYGISISTENYH